ncbi:hypothetical protein [Methylomonas sp. UP202]|uniref:hypothetical protein n=1 Tax=Methylomonas sp. UP202 TaxID=3040943 RepID=UPI0024784A18|nr:hypothetical protein [Methylomonas sp. UP202]WGS84728.1 hypothetical protein QC632_16915 [Methylomonas sp. UP202]
MKISFDDAVTLPRDVFGFLEWSSGVIWINMESNQYYDWLDSEDRRKGPVNEAINHELFHALQVATCGYMNYYASLILKELVTENKDRIMSEFGRGFFEDWFKWFFSEIPKPNTKVEQYLESLDETSNQGVSTREIIEGAAYLWQKKSINRNISCEEYISKLRFAPGTDYTNAFLYAYKVLGNKAFDLYFSIAFVSLCFLEPQKVFPIICEELTNRNCNNFLSAYLVGQKLSTDFYYLGDMTTCFRHIDFKSKGMEWINPLHKETVSKINELSTLKGVSIVEMMSDPFLWLLDLSEYMHRPIIFNSGEVSLFGGKSIFEYSGRQRDKVLDFVPQLYFGVYCFLIYQQTGKGPKFLKLSI